MKGLPIDEYCKDILDLSSFSPLYYLTVSELLIDEQRHRSDKFSLIELLILSGIYMSERGKLN